MSIFNKLNKNKTQPLVFSILIANSTICASISETDFISGSSGVSVETSGTTTTVDAINAGQHATANWSSFNVQSDETVIFQQANENAVIVNNISDINNKASTIEGTIQANGHVFLINNDGFVFTGGATINTNGFLASTYDFDEADLTNNELNLEGASTASIKLNNLDASQTENYIAFYSPTIEIGDTTIDGTDVNTTELSLGSGDAHFNTSNYGTITLPGLATGFTVNPDNITDGLADLLSITTDVVITSAGTIKITQSDIQGLLNSAVNLPEQFSATALELHSESAITIPSQTTTNLADYDFDNTNFTNLTLQTHCEIANNCNINIKNAIYGEDLNIDLIAGSGDNKSQVFVDYSNDNLEYSLLGGFNGLTSLDITASNFTLRNSLRAESLDISGNLTLDAQNQDSITFNANTMMSVSDSLNVTGTLDELNIFTSDLTLHSASTQDSAASNINNIYINTLSFTTSGTFKFNEEMTLFANSGGELDLILEGDLTFIGTKFTSDELNIRYSSETNIDSQYSLNYGIADRHFESVSIASLNTQVTTLDQMNYFVSFNDPTQDRLQLNGNISTNHFSVYGDNEISLEGNLNISSLTNIDLSNSVIDTSQFSFSATGDNTGTAEFNKINAAEGISITGFNTIGLSGAGLSTNTGNINISSNTINATAIANSEGEYIYSISTNSGDISITPSITLIDPSAGIKSSLLIDIGLGKIQALNGATQANDITLEKSLFNANDHNIHGIYGATGAISFAGFGTIISTGLDLNASTIDLTDTSINLNETGSFTSTAQTTSLGAIDKATNININGSNVDLYGNLTSNGELNFDLQTINLLDDITMKGDINLLDRKGFDGEDNTGTLRYININGTFGDPVAMINGSNDLTMVISNQDLYLYNLGAGTPLSSLTVLAQDSGHSGNLHFVGTPNIAGTRGLSISANEDGDANWNWAIEDDFEFTTSDYNLDLSGVNISSSGILTLGTGFGDLSLNSVDAVDLIISEANNLSLYGDITLSEEAANGYDFSNVNSIVIHDDLTIGSSEVPTAVNFGEATLDGTYSLTLYSDSIKLGTIGSNIALQNLYIYQGEALDLEINNNITLVGTAEINASSLKLDADIQTSGLDININTTGDITMSATSMLNAENGNIFLNSTTGNIGIATLTADTLIDINAQAGFINNEIGDYISDSDTSINLVSEALILNGALNIGESVSNPIVISLNGSGNITANSNGDIYLANLSDSAIISNSRVFDSSSVADEAILDAYNQVQLSSFNDYIEPSYQTTLGLIDHFNWQTFEDEETVRKIKTPASAPNLYRGRNGWRLGY